MRTQRNSKQEQLRPHWGLYVFFGAIAVFSIIAGPVWAVKQHQFIGNTIRTTALVTKIENPNPLKQIYKPTFEFQTQAGHEWEVRAPYATAFWDYSVGQRIDIRYNPDSPRDAIPVGWLGIWIGPLSLTLFGCVICTGIGLDYLKGSQNAESPYSPPSAQ